jgi:hypothetical protein
MFKLAGYIKRCDDFDERTLDEKDYRFTRNYKCKYVKITSRKIARFELELTQMIKKERSESKLKTSIVMNSIKIRPYSKAKIFFYFGVITSFFVTPETVLQRSLLQHRL